MLAASSSVEKGDGGDADASLLEALSTIRQPAIVLDADLTIHHANPTFLELFQLTAADIRSRSLFALGEGDWDVPSVRDLLSDILSRGHEVKDRRLEQRFQGIGSKTLLVNGRPLSSEGSPSGKVLLSIEDRTEYEWMQHNMVARGEFAEKLIDSLPEAVLVLSSDLRVQSANQPFYDLFQVPPEETLGHYLYELGNGQWDIPTLRQLLGEILPRQAAFDDYEIEHEFEGIGWRLMALNARQLDHERLILLTIRDLTDAQASQRKLKESEQRFRVLVEAVAQAVWETDAAGVVVKDSPTWRAYTGQTLDECLGYGWVDAVHPEDRAYAERQWRDAVSMGQNVDAEFRLRGPDGGWRWTNVHAAPLRDAEGEIVKWVGMNLDVTERKEAESALAASQQRLQLAIDASRAGVYEHSVPLDESTYHSSRWAEILGYRREELPQHDRFMDWIFQQIHPDDRELVESHYAAFVQGWTKGYNVEVRLRHKQGHWVWVHAISRAMQRGEHGCVSRVVGVMFDITERKEAHQCLEDLAATLEQRVAQRTEELRAETRFIDAILDNQPNPVVVLDREGRIVKFNKAGEIAAGYDFEELRDTAALMDLIPPEEREGVERVKAAMSTGEAPVRYENHWCHRDGSRRLFSWNNTVLKDADGRVQYILGCGVDITEQRKAEQEARRHLDEAARLQRRQTANELATVVAHELNQPLGAISMFAAAGLHKLEHSPVDEKALAEVLQQVSDEALRGGEIIRRLRSFLSQGALDRVEVDLNKVVHSACALIRPMARDHGIHLDIAACGELPSVMGVQVQLEQVLLNLLHNAVEAVQEGGVEDGRIEVETRSEGDAVRVTIRDSGPGIDTQMVGSLFEPLHSTKKHGLGVGLSISRSLIRAHGGRLWVDPQVPGGVFHFTLPAVP